MEPAATGPGTVVAADVQLFTETGECPGEVLVLAQGGYLSWLEVCSWSDDVEVNLAAARAEQTMANLPYFVGRIVPSFMSYSPDTHRLEALSDRLVLACGEESRGELPYRPAAFLAERLGTELRHFPGGHTGLTTHPAEFSDLLRKALRV